MARRISGSFEGVLQRRMIDAVRQRMAYQNMSMAELARVTQTPYTTVRRAFASGNERSVSIQLLERMALALGQEFQVRLVKSDD